MPEIDQAEVERNHLAVVRMHSEQLAKSIDQRLPYWVHNQYLEHAVFLIDCAAALREMSRLLGERES